MLPTPPETPPAKGSLAERLTLPWTPGLSSPTVSPSGTLLPPDLSYEVKRHLEWEMRLPGLCEVAVEDEKRRCDAQVGAFTAERRIEDEAQVKWSATYLWAAFATGLAVGVVASVYVTN